MSLGRSAAASARRGQIPRDYMIHGVANMSIFIIDTHRASCIIVVTISVGGHRVPPSASEAPMKTRKTCADCGRTSERDEATCDWCGGERWETAPGHGAGTIVALATGTPPRTVLVVVALVVLLFLALALGQM
jgi:hypothetical protein